MRTSLRLRSGQVLGLRGLCWSPNTVLLALIKSNCMVLPFVRDLFTDVEKLPVFTRVASHLKEGAGRIRVSGLVPTAKALLLVLLQKAVRRPLIVVVPDNRSAEDLVPVLQAFCELTGAADTESVVWLPNHDVLPFQNLSP